jgi:hypothetical protein
LAQIYNLQQEKWPISLQIYKNLDIFLVDSNWKLFEMKTTSNGRQP